MDITELIGDAHEMSSQKYREKTWHKFYSITDKNINHYYQNIASEPWQKYEIKKELNLVLFENSMEERIKFSKFDTKHIERIISYH